jgi:hypothetical protein
VNSRRNGFAFGRDGLNIFSRLSGHKMHLCCQLCIV